MRSIRRIGLLFILLPVLLLIICPPVAAASIAESGNNVAIYLTSGATWDDYLDLDYSGMSNTTVSSWLWDFNSDNTIDKTGGSGSVSDSGTYPYSAVGTYTVTLTVIYSDTTTEDIVAAITIEEPSTFIASADIDVNEDDLEITYESTTEGAVSWYWDFGVVGDEEDTDDEESGTYTYDETGSYIVTLTATSEGGTTDTYSEEIDFDVGPTADFSVDYEIGGAPHYVRFTDESKDSDAEIVEWDWDFDYGSNGDEFTDDDDSADTEFIYYNAGNYNATLTVTDGDGYKSSYVVEIEVVDADLAPEVDFKIDDDYSDTGRAPFTVEFNDLSEESDETESDLDDWYWEFYDEDNEDIDTITSRSESGPTITFSEAGDYTARLTVVDDDGIAATKVKKDYIEVKPQTTATKTATPTQTATPIVTYTIDTTATVTSSANVESSAGSAGNKIFGLPGTEFFRSEMGRFYNFYEEYTSLLAGLFGMG